LGTRRGKDPGPSHGLQLAKTGRSPGRCVACRQRQLERRLPVLRMLSPKRKENATDCPPRLSGEYACRAGTTSLYTTAITRKSSRAYSATYADATARRRRLPHRGSPSGRRPSVRPTAGPSPLPSELFCPNNFGLFGYDGQMSPDGARTGSTLPITAASPGLIRQVRPKARAASFEAVAGRPTHFSAARHRRWYGAPDDYLWDTGFRVVCHALIFIRRDSGNCTVESKPATRVPPNTILCPPLCRVLRPSSESELFLLARAACDSSGAPNAPSVRAPADQ